MGKRHFHSCFLIIVIGIIFFENSACKKEKLANLITSDIIQITQTSAVCGGNITDDGGGNISERGICWSNFQNPTISDSKSIVGVGEGVFSCNITGLLPNTIYFVRAYATNKAGTAYGNQQTVKTFSGTVTDVDGNVYYTVTIGNQVWMAENLNVTHYTNGDTISNAASYYQWSHPVSNIYCNYDNNIETSKTYGKLYNWLTVMDIRHIAPLGWHVPADSEWTKLADFLGGVYMAGAALKEQGTAHWLFSNSGETNISGFTAIPGGRRLSEGTFEKIGTEGYWWSTTEYYACYAYLWNLTYRDNYFTRNGGNKSDGYAVRCVKD